MEYTDFISLAQILTFPGMITTVMLLVQFTKKMFDKALPGVHTRYVVYMWSVLLCALAATILGDWVVPLQTIVTWFINSVIVWFTAMKAYETLTDKPASV